jgi:hypothetical protein
VSASSASSGMQRSSLQTSQFACARIVALPLAARGNRDLHRKHHLVFVAEIHQVRRGQAPRMRPLDRPRLVAVRELPADRRRLAGISGIAPIGMPVRDHLQPSARRGSAGPLRSPCALQPARLRRARCAPARRTTRRRTQREARTSFVAAWRGV